MKKEQISFELWKDKKTNKNKRVIIVRNEKGRFLSKIHQKGSGIKTKAQVYKKYKKDLTLSKNTTQISYKKEQTKNKKVQNLILKGRDKTQKVNVSKSGFKSATKIGRNTTVLRTKNKIRSQQHYQFICVALWGDKNIQTIGYSDIRGTKEQAFNRAVSGAIMKGLMQGSGYKIEFTGKKKGQAVKGKHIIKFTFEIDIQTYINTIKKY